MLLGMALFTASYGQKYFGKTYPATKNVDLYFDLDDVKKPYTVMGSTELAQGFRSLEKVQEKIIKLAKSKGADGIFLEIKEEVISTQQTGLTTVGKTKKKKKALVTESNSTYDVKQKKMKAKFLKYDD